MKASASIELVWHLAAEEAKAAEFKEIEPEHFLAALLKFAELPVAEIDKIVAGASAAEELSAEVHEVRGEFDARSIDTTRARRELRTKLGKGGNPHNGGTMHRSSASRALFDAAAKMADESRNTTVTAMHLLRALLASPTAVMSDVLGGALGADASRGKESPLLAECGRDLAEAAKNEKGEAIFAAAAGRDDVMLFVPAIDLPEDEHDPDAAAWRAGLKNALAKGSVRCICRANPGAYARWLRKDPEWKRLVHTMWLGKADVPWEL